MFMIIGALNYRVTGYYEPSRRPGCLASCTVSPNKRRQKLMMVGLTPSNLDQLLSDRFNTVRPVLQDRCPACLSV